MHISVETLEDSWKFGAGRLALIVEMEDRNQVFQGSSATLTNDVGMRSSYNSGNSDINNNSRIALMCWYEQRE